MRVLLKLLVSLINLTDTWVTGYRSEYLSLIDFEGGHPLEYFGEATPEARGRDVT
jgi:hypothetical protein